jgi:hypothetical protein
VIEKVGFDACSTDIEGCGCLVLLSNCGGSTGGGCLAPLVEVESSLSRSADADVICCGLLRGLEANSFTGGVGATDSSTGSAPSGPSGPVESSRLSRVVDWVSLTCRRGPRDLEAAGLADMGEAVVVAVGAGAAAASVEGVCSASAVSTVGYATCQGYAYRLVVRCPLLPWRGYGLILSARGRLRKGGQLARHRKQVVYPSLTVPRRASFLHSGDIPRVVVGGVLGCRAGHTVIAIRLAPATASLGWIDVRQVSVTNTKHVPSLSPADTKPRLHISIPHKVCRKCPVVSATFVCRVTLYASERAVFEFCHLTGPIPSKR